MPALKGVRKFCLRQYLGRRVEWPQAERKPERQEGEFLSSRSGLPSRKEDPSLREVPDTRIRLVNAQIVGQPARRAPILSITQSHRLESFGHYACGQGIRRRVPISRHKYDEALYREVSTIVDDSSRLTGLWGEIDRVRRGDSVQIVGKQLPFLPVCP